MWAILTLAAARGAACTTGDVDESVLRARAWAMIAHIHAESVRSACWTDEVRRHRDDGTVHHFASIRVIADDLRQSEESGELRVTTPGDRSNMTRQPFHWTVRRGVLKSYDFEHDSLVIRPFQSDRVHCRSLPGLWTGLGRSPNMMRSTSRSEYLLSGDDLRVESESRDRVVLTCRAETWRSLYLHRIEMDAATGDVLLAQAIRPEWRAVSVEWSMPEWTQVGGVRVPVRTEYRLWTEALSAEDRRRLREALDAAGLPRDAGDPRHKRFAEWLAVRDQTLGLGPTPTKLLDAWQSAQTTVHWVNRDLTDRPADWPPLPKATRMFSAFLESPVSGPDADP